MLPQFPTPPEADPLADSEAVSSFSTGLQARRGDAERLFQTGVTTVRSTRLTIREAINAILSDFERFDLDESIYVDLRSRYKTLLERLSDCPRIR